MLDALFNPRAVAVIGASNKPLSIGHRVMRNIIGSGYKGKLYPIHPKEASIQDVRAYPSIEEVPGEVDLVNIAIRNVFVPQVMEHCGRKGVKFVIIHTSGFREIGGQGVELERQIVEIATRYGMRIYGPNSQGVMNSDPEVSLYANFTFTPMTPGNISICAQSGGVAELLNLNLHKVGAGFRFYASNGNASDVSNNELLEYFGQDEATKVIMLYIENLKDPGAFMEITSAITRKKPILAYKSGKTEEAARAISSHTGSLMGQDTVSDMIFEKCGIMRFSSTEQMVNTAVALSMQPLPRGRRLAIVANAGGPGIIAIDESVGAGLEMAELAPETRARLREALVPEASVENPVDVAATAGPAHFRAAVSELVADDNVDAILIPMVTPFFVDCEGVAREIVAAAKGAGKPILSAVMTNDNWASTVRTIREGGIPVYDYPEAAATVLGHMLRIEGLLGRKADAPEFFEADSAAASAIMAGRPEGVDLFLNQGEVFGLLEAHGLPVAPYRFLDDKAALADAAVALGYPVVLKVDSPQAVHKTEAGGVILDIDGPGALARAADTLADRFNGVTHRYLLQKQVRGGRELIMGVKKIEGVGHAIMFGLGGIYVEVLEDVVFRLAPLSREEALGMVGAIKGAPLLEGVRGEAPVDRAALVEMLLRLSRLAMDHPGLEELDLNPVMAFPAGRPTLAVDGRVKVKGHKE